MKERVLIDKTRMAESRDFVNKHTIFQEDDKHLVVEVDEEDVEEVVRRTGGLRSMDE